MSKLDELLSPERLREINESREDADHRRSVAIATLQGCIKELQANGEHQAVACIEKILTKTEDKP